MTIITSFEIPYVQYLNEQGNPIETLPPISKDIEQLKHIYCTMQRTRAFDKKAIALQRTGKLGTYPSIYGQEAVSTAIGAAMRPEDVLVPYYRDYAAQFQRGIKMSEILAYWGGDERGSQFSCSSEDLPISVPIASQCLHATGVAFAFQYRKQPRVAVVSIGDGGTSEGDFYEALNVAGIWKLPVVFVVNNNQWAISVPLAKQTASQTIAQKAIAAGFQGMQVDGNDVLASRQVIGEAIEKARLGGGPTLIEALTYRLCDHTTSDDAKRYQPGNEVEAAQLKEPIGRFKNFLISANLWSESEEAHLQQRIEEEIKCAVEEYLGTKPQPVMDLFDYHFATLPDYLIEQRAIAFEEARE